MADIEPPSFSLGIDFDFEPPSNQNQPESSTRNDIDESQWWVPDSDPDSEKDGPPSRGRRLRRLRRGGVAVSDPVAASPVLSTPNLVEDDIEDFSEEEILRTGPSSASQHQNMCSSSKPPLSGCGVLIRPQASAMQNSKSCPPTSVASNKGKSVISDFSSSPLRMFQLLDSDSDDPSDGPVVKGNASRVEFSKNIMQKELNHGSSKVSCPEKDLSASASKKRDLWEDFCVDKNVSVPTPVFDELLEELYNSGRQNKAVSVSREFGSSGMASNMNNAREFMEPETIETDGFPCHRYFSHNDTRIQRLVRNRLPYFCPLSVPGNIGNQPYNASSSIDYRSQFGNERGVNQTAGNKVNVQKAPRRATKKKKKSNTEDDSHTAGTWIDPKQTSSTPKDAGRRRVRADGQSPGPGQWVTGDNGKKVYITRAGKELTGQLAYRQFKKESGGFTKPRKKPASKKKR